MRDSFRMVFVFGSSLSNTLFFVVVVVLLFFSSPSSIILDTIVSCIAAAAAADDEVFFLLKFVVTRFETSEPREKERREKNRRGGENVTQKSYSHTHSHICLQLFYAPLLRHLYAPLSPNRKELPSILNAQSWRKLYVVVVVVDFFFSRYVSRPTKRSVALFFFLFFL